MVCCKKCKHYETNLQNDDKWIGYCNFDGMFLDEIMVVIGDCDAYVSMDSNDTEE